MRMLLTALGAALLLVGPLEPERPYVGAALAGDRGAHLATRAPESAAGDPDAGAELLGTAAPPWTFTRWIGPPLSPAELGGRVVLLRWWTDGCHFCAATLPELEALRRRYADQGLMVIGAYHPKPPREVSDRRIAATARRLGFRGPLAVDRDWVTLERYWLGGHPERSWTSVSFLIDRAGRIRWVHGGGEYHRSTDPAHARCARQYADLERTLASVLAERAPAP